MPPGLRLWAFAALVVVALTACGGPRPVARRGPDTLPAQLGDQEFWTLVNDFSEPNGYFRSDNFLSNELAFQRVLTQLPTGGVYMGVGPEQNFTYIVAMRPKFAFIVDIRRGNLDEQLLYKAFIEMSHDRADFLSRLFARSRPVDIGSGATVDALFSAYDEAPPSERLFEDNLRAARDWLVGRHGFQLTDQDLAGLEHVYTAFFEGGPQLNYSFLSGNGGFRAATYFPSYEDLMTQTDSRGEQRSYLATEENFRALQSMEKRNAIVPVVGNFAGPKAIRSVAKYLSDHNATVTAFYTSNVEMYLFQQADDWRKFYANVAELPVDDTSAFIRSISGRGFQASLIPGARANTRLSSIMAVENAFRAGRIRSYGDVIALSR